MLFNLSLLLLRKVIWECRIIERIRLLGVDVQGTVFTQKLILKTRKMILTLRSSFWHGGKYYYSHRGHLDGTQHYLPRHPEKWHWRALAGLRSSAPFQVSPWNRGSPPISLAQTPWPLQELVSPGQLTLLTRGQSNSQVSLPPWLESLISSASPFSQTPFPHTPPLW